MRRTRSAWLLALPLAAAGMFCAHEVAWQLSHDHSAERAAAHGYLAQLPLFAALAGAVLVLGLVAQLARAATGARVADAPSARVFAALPITGFLVQEHLEHLAIGRELDPAFFVSTPFLLGLLLQLPFAVAAYLVARSVLEFVASVARSLGPLRLRLAGVAPLVPVATPELPLRPALAVRQAGRAPPPPL